MGGLARTGDGAGRAVGGSIDRSTIPAVARLFVAVRPSPEVSAVLGSLDRTDDPDIRWVPDHQWHITLRFWPDVAVEPVVEALDSAVSHHSPELRTAIARLGPRTERLGPSAIVVPVSGLDALADGVRAATEPGLSGLSGLVVDDGAAPGPGDRPAFRGHLTLGRFRGRPRRHRSSAVLGLPIEASFSVREIEMVESELGRTGATHRVIRAWRLTE